jgi:hypothetical protein
MFVPKWLSVMMSGEPRNFFLGTSQLDRQMLEGRDNNSFVVWRESSL